ncbi:HVO_A0114 family putative DNA-binding protein [Abyssibacter profundi]|uniref:Transcriptional regulator n=1 Tax=Abyssibacter profundi TaxID=2182787 RepID=A0A363UL84_9GAMM|nr:transcriptional regulator [Abyssibacter profundi]PWN56181.1 transcriptional regulator [Abyssibacter profundi]
MATLTLTVQTTEQFKASALSALNAGGDGGDAVHAFASAELLFDLLTTNRLGVLRALCGVGAIGLRELARRVERDPTGVLRDVKALTDAGVLRRSEDGKVSLGFDAVHVDCTLEAAA